METQRLSPATLKIIDSYLNLPFPGRTVKAPYYNNRRAALRGGLRVLIGKGSPEDIAEEALIISLRERIDLTSLDNETLKKFLVDNKLGIDCSGLAYYILDAECRTRQLGTLKKYIVRPYVKNPLRKLLITLRPIENTGVKTFGHPLNSSIVKIADCKPGDIIVMLASGQAHDYDHILVVHEVERQTSPNPSSVEEGKREPSPSQRRGQGEVSSLTIHYTHSLQWRTDGLYNHGVSQGTITVTEPTSSLLDQTWIEKGATGAANETLERAKQAKELHLRRLRFLSHPDPETSSG